MSQTYNPILAEEKISSRGLISEWPTPGPGVALVLVRRNGASVVLREGQSLTVGERALGGFHTCHRIDVTERVLTFPLTLPSATMGREFPAEFRVRCAVANPADLIARGAQHVCDRLEAELKNIAIPTTRSFKPDQIREAEAEVTAVVRAHRFDFPVSVSILSVVLSPDPAEVRRRQSEAEQDWRRGDELGQTMHEVAVQEIKGNAVMTFLMQGDPGLMTLHLVKHPEDTENILVRMQEARERGFEQRIAFIREMIERGFLQLDQLSDSIAELARSDLRAMGSRNATSIQIDAEMPAVRLSGNASDQS